MGFRASIYVANSRRDSVFMYFGKRDVTQLILTLLLVNEALVAGVCFLVILLSYENAISNLQYANPLGKQSTVLCLLHVVRNFFLRKVCVLFLAYLMLLPFSLIMWLKIPCFLWAHKRYWGDCHALNKRCYSPCHFMCDHFIAGIISLPCVTTKPQPADISTKDMTLDCHALNKRWDRLKQCKFCI